MPTRSSDRRCRPRCEHFCFRQEPSLSNADLRTVRAVSRSAVRSNALSCSCSGMQLQWDAVAVPVSKSIALSARSTAAAVQAGLRCCTRNASVYIGDSFEAQLFFTPVYTLRNKLVVLKFATAFFFFLEIYRPVYCLAEV